MLWSAKMENKASANDDSEVKVLVFCQPCQQNSALQPSRMRTKGLSLLLLPTRALKHQPPRARRSHRLLSCCSLSLGGPWPHPTFPPGLLLSQQQRRGQGREATEVRGCCGSDEWVSKERLAVVFPSWQRCGLSLGPGEMLSCGRGAQSRVEVPAVVRSCLSLGMGSSLRLLPSASRG